MAREIETPTETQKTQLNPHPERVHAVANLRMGLPQISGGSPLSVLPADPAPFQKLAQRSNRRALLVGVGDAGDGFSPLAAVAETLEAVGQVLAHPEVGGFGEVKTLLNPDRQTLEAAIEQWVSDRPISAPRSQLMLLYFCGWGVLDAQGKIYLTTGIARRGSGGKFIKATGVPLTTLQTLLQESWTHHQAILLDCCFRAAALQSPHRHPTRPLNLQRDLGGKGRVILAGSTSIQEFQEAAALGSCLYTHYLVEGLRTGLADRNRDGMISLQDAHDYACRQLKLAAPARQPRIFGRPEARRVILAQAAIADPARVYRRDIAQLQQPGENGLRSDRPQLRGGVGPAKIPLLPLVGLGIALGLLGAIALVLYPRWQTHRAEHQTLERLEQHFHASDYPTCLQEAATLPAGSPVYAKAQTLAGLCREALAQTQLQQAQQLAATGQLQAAIARAAQIPAASPSHAQAQDLQRQWAEQILRLATAQYQAGEQTQALNLARSVTTPAAPAAAAQTLIQQWQAAWTANQQRLQAAQAALAAQQWQQALDLAQQLPQLPPWQTQAAPILQTAKAELQRLAQPPAPPPAPVAAPARARRLSPARDRKRRSVDYILEHAPEYEDTRGTIQDWCRRNPGRC